MNESAFEAVRHSSPLTLVESREDNPLRGEHHMKTRNLLVALGSVIVTAAALALTPTGRAFAGAAGKITGVVFTDSGGNEVGNTVQLAPGSSVSASPASGATFPVSGTVTVGNTVSVSGAVTILPSASLGNYPQTSEQSGTFQTDGVQGVSPTFDVSRFKQVRVALVLTQATSAASVTIYCWDAAGTISFQIDHAGLISNGNRYTNVFDVPCYLIQAITSDNLPFPTSGQIFVWGRTN
jgi:hypothetical protein